MVTYRVVIYGFPVSDNREKSAHRFSKTYYVRQKIQYTDVFGVFEDSDLRLVRDKSKERDRVTIGIQSQITDREALTREEFKEQLGRDIENIRWHKARKDHGVKTPRVKSPYKDEYESEY